MVHHSSSAYLWSNLYHQPLPESQKSRNLPRTTSRRQNLRPWAITTNPTLGPSAKDVGYIPVKVNRLSISVVRHTCRVIYITSTAQNLKNLKICPNRPSGVTIGAFEHQGVPQTSDQALRTSVTYIPPRWCNSLSRFELKWWEFDVTSRNLRLHRSASAIDLWGTALFALEPKVRAQNLAQTLRSFLQYMARNR